MARVEYSSDNTNTPDSVSFVDPGGDGTYSTSGCTAQIISTPMVEFTFDEDNPPVSVVVYGWNAASDKYSITHLNSGDSEEFYEVTDFGKSQIAGTDHYEPDIFGNFNNAKLKIDMTDQNFNTIKGGGGFGATLLTHAYVIFTFNA